MKIVFEKTGILLVLFFAIHNLNAQILNVWIGGMPGRPIDWNVAANWSLQRVPNEFHDVVIPNTATTTFSYPVIYNDVEIHSLRIECGAKLFILEEGKLRLNATGTNMNDVLANNGEIENRSRYLIDFDESVFNSSGSLVAEKKY